MKHYFQPGREDFRRTLTEKLPALLGGAPENKPLESDDLRAMLAKMGPKTWQKIRHELLERLSRDPDAAEPVEAKVDGAGYSEIWRVFSVRFQKPTTRG